MSLSILTNISAMNTQQNLLKSSNAVSTSMARLSSGLRINSAADDAAGYAIS
jgi:flagellin